VQATNTINEQEFRGKMHLIDLAGSERISKSGVTGQQLKEAKCINQSLSELGNCIQARGELPLSLGYPCVGVSRGGCVGVGVC